MSKTRSPRARKFTHDPLVWYTKTPYSARASRGVFSFAIDVDVHEPRFPVRATVRWGMHDARWFVVIGSHRSLIAAKKACQQWLLRLTMAKLPPIKQRSRVTS